jgi:hypothetical protein
MSKQGAHHPLDRMFQYLPLRAMRKRKERAEGKFRALVLLSLATQPQTLNQFTVGVGILPAQVLQVTAALTDEFKQPAAAVFVVLMNLEVFGELFNAGGQDGDLDFG